MQPTCCSLYRGWLRSGIHWCRELLESKATSSPAYSSSLTEGSFTICVTARMAPGLTHMKDDQSGIWRKLAAQTTKQKIKTKDLHIMINGTGKRRRQERNKGKTDEDIVSQKKMSKDQGLEEDKQGPEEDLLKFELTTCSNRMQRKTFSYCCITAVLQRWKKYNPTVCQQHRLILTQRTTAHRLHNVLEESHWWNYQLDPKR